MSAVLAHRGPDYQGSFTDAGICMACRGLEITGIGSGSQPMLSEDGTLCVVFNGEVYNYLQLRTKLESHGRKFSTNCDTEVLLHAYSEYGEDFVNLLEGEFAFALYDSKSSVVLLVRDRFGVKPLYYFVTPKGQFFFSSEIKGILASGEVNPQLGYAQLSGYIKPYGNYSPIKGVMQVLPGTTLKLLLGEPSNFAERRYYACYSVPVEESEELICSALRQKISSVVHQMIATEVPFGVLLSGGIDSGIICGLVSKEVENVRTFCVGSVETNEFLQAQQTSDFLSTTHTSVELTSQQVIQSLPSVVYSLEHYDSRFLRTAIPMNRVMQSVSRNHIKVVLCGEGADEMFAGYHTEFSSLMQTKEKMAIAMELKSAVESLYQWHLLRLDRISMAHSVESRVPFMDRSIVEYALGIDVRLKLQRGIEKSILRKAFSDLLPSSTVNRPKTPFGVGAGIDFIFKKEFGGQLQQKVQEIFKELFIEGKKPSEISV
jgi:asparagine synthase (glutamine-hydrolysing)